MFSGNTVVKLSCRKNDTICDACFCPMLNASLHIFKFPFQSCKKSKKTDENVQKGEGSMSSVVGVKPEDSLRRDSESSQKENGGDGLNKVMPRRMCTMTRRMPLSKPPKSPATVAKQETTEEGKFGNYFRS